MAVITTLEKIAVKMLLNNGTDSQGNLKTVGVSLGSLSTSGYDASKVLAVVDAIEGCLTKTVSYVQEVRTSTLTED